MARGVRGVRHMMRTYRYVRSQLPSSLFWLVGPTLAGAWGAVAGRSSVTLDATLGTDEAEGAIGI